MKNILIVTVAYPSIIDPLNGIFVKDYAECISNKYKVTVLNCTKLPENSKIKPGLQIEELESIKVINVFVKNNFLPWTVNIVLGFIKGLNYIQKNNILIDIVHCHFFPSVIPFLFKFRKKPVILTEHWSGFPLKQLTKLNTFIAKLTIRHCKVVCPVSLFLLQSIEKYGIHGNFKVIPNPINEKIFFYKKKELSSIIKILFIGQQIPVRNTPIILNAIKEISNEISNFHLDIVGGGSHLDEYIKLSNELGIQKFVTFHGPVLKKYIVDYIHSSDFSIIPAGIETQSVFLNESMACGKPILSANTGAPIEYVDEKIGMVIDPKNIKEWKKGIIAMINNLKNFDPIEISQVAKENFSYATILKKYEKIYEKVASDVNMNFN